MDSERTRNLDGEFLKSPTRKAVWLWVSLGAALFYFSTWVGPLSFYWYFQRPLEEGASAVEGGVVWSLPVATAASSGKKWERRRLGALLVPVPPGEFQGLTEEGVDAVAQFAEGTVRYTVFPAGFVRQLYLAEHDAVDTVAGELQKEAALCRTILETTPEEYQFGWDATTRMKYAARILSKMRLLRDLPVERLELYESSDGQELSVLAGYASGATSIVAVTERGTLVVYLSDEVPTEWTASASSWLPEPVVSEGAEASPADSR